MVNDRDNAGITCAPPTRRYRAAVLTSWQSKEALAKVLITLRHRVSYEKFTILILP
jgi:hypothetical protein